MHDYFCHLAKRFLPLLYRLVARLLLQEFDCLTGVLVTDRRRSRRWAGALREEVIGLVAVAVGSSVFFVNSDGFHPSRPTRTKKSGTYGNEPVSQSFSEYIQIEKNIYIYTK